MQQSMGALPSVTTGPDQFWDELMAKSPHDIAGVRWTTALEAVGARKSPPVSCEKSAPLLAEFASERVNVPTLTLENRRVHSPMTMHAMDAQSVGRACDLGPQNRHASQPHRQYKRAVTSTTALRFLHIPADMHRELGLGEIYSKQPAGRRDNVCTVHLVTGAIRAPVVMSRTTSIRQHHRRFSTGWREFCARADVEIGDELMFERTGTSKELAVRAVKAGLSKAIRGR